MSEDVDSSTGTPQPTDRSHADRDKSNSRDTVSSAVKVDFDEEMSGGTEDVGVEEVGQVEGGERRLDRVEYYKYEPPAMVVDEGDEYNGGPERSRQLNPEGYVDPQAGVVVLKSADEVMTHLVAASTRAQKVVRHESQLHSWSLHIDRFKRYVDYGIHQKLLAEGSIGIWYFVSVLVLLVGCFALFCAVPLPGLMKHTSPFADASKRTRTRPAGIVAAVIVPIMLLLSVVFYLFTSLMDPGYVPTDWFTPIPNMPAQYVGVSLDQESDSKDSTTIPIESHSNQDSTLKSPHILHYVTINGYDVLLKYCSTCNIWRPPRASHCGQCGRCILRHDHHCPWTRNCIGIRNQRFFILFLFWVVLTGAAVIVFSAVDLAMGSRNEVEQKLPQYRLVIDIVLIALIGFFLLPVISMLVMHVYLVAINMTTREEIKWRKGSVTRDQLIQRVLDAREKAALIQNRNQGNTADIDPKDLHRSYHKNESKDVRDGAGNYCGIKGHLAVLCPTKDTVDEIRTACFPLEDPNLEREENGDNDSDYNNPIINPTNHTEIDVDENKEPISVDPFYTGNHEPLTSTTVTSDQQHLANKNRSTKVDPDELLLSQLNGFGVNGWRVHREKPKGLFDDKDLSGKRRLNLGRKDKNADVDRDENGDESSSASCRMPNVGFAKSSRLGLTKKYGPYDNGVIKNFKEVIFSRIPASYELV